MSYFIGRSLSGCYTARANSIYDVSHPVRVNNLLFILDTVTGFSASYSALSRSMCHRPTMSRNFLIEFKCIRYKRRQSVQLSTDNLAKLRKLP